LGHNPEDKAEEEDEHAEPEEDEKEMARRDD
jgi:hypothetical protein